MNKVSRRGFLRGLVGVAAGLLVGGTVRPQPTLSQGTIDYPLALAQAASRTREVHAGNAARAITYARQAVSACPSTFADLLDQRIIRVFYRAYDEPPQYFTDSHKWYLPKKRTKRRRTKRGRH